MNPNPFSKTFTLTALNAVGYAGVALTGVGPFAIPIANKPADGLGHQVTLQSAANLSGINMTLLGTDANGNPCTEVLAGPNAGTATSVKHYATLASITPAATLGANTMGAGWNNDIVSQWYSFKSDVANFLAAIAVILSSGTATFNVEHTYDAPLSEACVSFADVTAAVANQEFAYNSITFATRLHVTVQNTAVLDYRIIQGTH